MGLFDWLKGLVGGGPPRDSGDSSPEQTLAQAAEKLGIDRRDRAPTLKKLRYRSALVHTPGKQTAAGRKRPYIGAPRDVRVGTWLDFSTDADPRWLDYYGLPLLKTPDDLAAWLGIPFGKLAWLSCRWKHGFRPATVDAAHYHFRWVQKRSGGLRLIEAPKVQLKAVQLQILRGILDHVPVHPQAHGFCHGRSTLTNAEPHVGRRIVLKLDLENFYPNVRYSRVVAIFRGLGFSRDVALWLSRLTTSAVPWNADSKLQHPLHLAALGCFQRHLPQGAPTSPALANLSAYALDVRMAGLARKFSANYTRYADDLTFSGARRFAGALRDFIPLARQIVRDERFRLNRSKGRVLRNNQRQTVTGVVVNSKPNVRRDEYDCLKATLHNCLKLGPAGQNRDRHPRFAEHLRGRIAYVTQLNAVRGAKLLAMYERIDWQR
ncbi:MAG: reverse transcriptase family protein [Planctomycetaceae bacterium]